jgi:hypothetical protein
MIYVTSRYHSLGRPKTAKGGNLGPVSCASATVRGKRFTIHKHSHVAHMVGSKTARDISEVHRLRSTQFDPIPIDEAPEEHRKRNQPSLSETLKRFGYSRNNQVRLYGQVFDLMSDPVEVSENFVFVDGLERKSGQLRRVRIPRTIIQMARMKGRTA